MQALLSAAVLFNTNFIFFTALDTAHLKASSIKWTFTGIMSRV